MESPAYAIRSSGLRMPFEAASKWPGHVRAVAGRRGRRTDWSGSSRRARNGLHVAARGDRAGRSATGGPRQTADRRSWRRASRSGCIRRRGAGGEWCVRRRPSHSRPANRLGWAGWFGRRRSRGAIPRATAPGACDQLGFDVWRAFCFSASFGGAGGWTGHRRFRFGCLARDRARSSVSFRLARSLAVRSVSSAPLQSRLGFVRSLTVAARFLPLPYSRGSVSSARLQSRLGFRFLTVVARVFLRSFGKCRLYRGEGGVASAGGAASGVWRARFGERGAGCGA
jgi:hypothetical protein